LTGKGVSKEVSKGITELAQAAVADIDETDLSPQVNMALRQQVVQYVTLGVKEAITNPTPPPIEKTILQEVKEFLYPVNDFAAVENMEVTEYILDSMHPFKSFAPRVFKTLREEEGIDDNKYLKTLSSTANERLSEGASGAFMFFCGGGEFIVKTIRDREARVLHASLKRYSRYLKKNKNSLLCRFLGSYSLAMYEQTFYFVVMLNCFDHKAKINERYDIKGSWVNRSADHVKPSKKVVCRHCNEMFIPAAKEECPVIVGRHEANVVLKDNDLRNRISLKYEEAKHVVAILKKDSDLLGELGVLDYSLLIGVKKGKFEIHGEGIAVPVS
jgi:1-phosphatidylinositol-4-phosphate 5-kinase